MRDAERAIAFYADVLGAREKWRVMHYQRVGHAILRLADAEFIVLRFDDEGRARRAVSVLEKRTRVRADYVTLRGR